VQGNGEGERGDATQEGEREVSVSGEDGLLWMGQLRCSDNDVCSVQLVGHFSLVILHPANG